MIICYTVSEIWHVTDVTFIFHFCLFFALLPPYCLKTENFKKMKTRLEITSFYTSVPKIMIKCYLVSETWCMTDVIVIFHLGLFPTDRKSDIKRWVPHLKKIILQNISEIICLKCLIAN